MFDNSSVIGSIVDALLAGPLPWIALVSGALLGVMVLLFGFKKVEVILKGGYSDNNYDSISYAGGSTKKLDSLEYDFHVHHSSTYSKERIDQMWAREIKYGYHSNIDDYSLTPTGKKLKGYGQELFDSSNYDNFTYGS